MCGGEGDIHSTVIVAGMCTYSVNGTTMNSILNLEKKTETKTVVCRLRTNSTNFTALNVFELQ